MTAGGRWTASRELPCQVASTCLYDSYGWLRAWESVGIESRRRHTYVTARVPGGVGPAVLPLYLVEHSPFWHGYELQSGLARLADEPLAFAGSTYFMYSRRGEVPPALAEGVHATAMEWIAAGEAGLLVIPNLTDEGVASWVAAMGEPTGRVLLDRTYWCDLDASLASYLTTRLPHKLRNDVRRRLRRSHERGLLVEVLPAATAHSLVPTAVPLTVGTTDEHDWPALYDETALHGLLRVPGAVLATARVGDELIGVFFGFQHGDEITFLCGGVDYATLPEFSTYVAFDVSLPRMGLRPGVQAHRMGTRQLPVQGAARAGRSGPVGARLRAGTPARP